MSAPGTHGTGDIWPGILDQWRCREVDEGRRCQLYAHHGDVSCAHAAGTPRRATLHRWRPGGDRWVDEVFPNGLRWCCMFAHWPIADYGDG